MINQNGLQIWGHRGCRGLDLYENSHAALKYAIQNFDGLETDATSTHDKVVYLAHDTKYITEVTYELAQHLDQDSAKTLSNNRLDQITYEVAQKLVLKDGTPLVKLEELLKLGASNPFATLNLELKGAYVFDSVYKMLEKYYGETSTPNKIILSSFSMPVMQDAAKKRSLGYDVAPIFSASTAKTAKMYPWYAEEPSYYIPFSLDYLKTSIIQDLNPDFLHLECSDVTLDNINQVQKILPKTKVSFWSLQENIDQIVELTKEIFPTGMLHAAMVDNPASFKAAIKNKCPDMPLYS